MTLLKKQSTKGVSDKVKEDIKNTPNYAAGNSGMFNTHVVEPVPFYNVTEAGIDQEMSSLVMVV